MLKRLSSLDVFGQQFTFNAYKDSGTYNTVLGGIITIIWMVFVSVVSIVIIREYLDTTKPVVSVNRIRLSKPLTINYEEYRTGLGNLLFDGKRFLTIEESKKYVTFGGRYLKRYQQGDQVVEETTQRKSFDCFKDDSGEFLEPLANQINQIKSKINLTVIFSKSMICVNLTKDQYTVEGNKSNLPFIWNTIDIYPCSLPDPTQCATPEELSTVQIGFIKLVKVANYSNKKSPLVPALDSDSFLYFDIATKTVLTVFDKMNDIYEDDNGILSERLTNTYVDVDYTNVVTGTRVTRSIYCSQAQIEGGAL